MDPAQFARLMNGFYATATRALIRSGAFIDKFVGDEVMVVYLPVFCGANHAKAAIEGARELLLATSAAPGPQSLPVGIGVNSGTCYFGTVAGTDGTLADFTALGDPVNVAARLAGAAAAGEALISEATREAAGIDIAACERRSLALKGRSEPTEVHCLRADGAPLLARTAGAPR
jgi:adenylate cyclase